MTASSTALLCVIGLLIASLWAWLWLGVGAGARRVAMRLDFASGSAAGEMSRLVWPLMPFLSLMWFVSADLIARENSGFDTLGPCALAIALLSFMVLLAIQSLYLGGLPEWAYPGWMARRYYRAHPGARERELGSASASAF